MNKGTFWLLAIVVCLGFALWGLGFGLGGCSSTLSEVTDSTSTSTTTTSTTAMSTTTTLALTWSGTKQFGGPGSGVNALLSDADGNIYAAGLVRIGLDGNANQGESDVFLVKFDSAGNRKWTQQIGSSGDDYPNSAARDKDGNIYIAGNTSGSLESNTNAGGLDAFLIKYDSNGNKQWAKQFGTGADDVGVSVAADSNGNIFLAGNTNGGLDGNENLGSEDFFLIKIDPSGNKQWTRQFGANLRDNIYCVKTDPDGNIYLAGRVGSDLPFTMDAFILKCDPAGNMLWTKQFGTETIDIVKSLAIDAFDNIYLAGVAGGTIIDFYLAKYDPSGNRQWIKQFGTANDDRCHAVTIDPSGNVHLAGETNGGLAGHTNAGDYDVFLMKTDPDGNELWTSQFGTDADDYCDCVVTDLNDNVFVGGNSLKGLDDGNPDHQGAFVVKFDPSGNKQ